MEQSNKREQWISEVISSSNGMQKTQPEADLYAKVMSNIDKHHSAQTISIPVKQWAAAAILLIAINACSVLYFTGSSHTAASGHTANPLATELKTGSTYNY